MLSSTISGLILPSPLAAAGVSASAAAALGIYGTYQFEIESLFNSIFGKILLTINGNT